MTIIGEAEIAVWPNTAGFDEQLRAKTDPGLRALSDDAGLAGTTAGTRLRTNMDEEVEKGTNDLEKAGKDGGGGFAKGLLNSLSGLANMVGIPLGQVGDKADDMGKHLSSTGGVLGTFGNKLADVGKVATVGLAAGLVVAGGVALKMGVDFQASVSSLAAQAGIPVKAAQQIGDAFLNTAGNTIYSGQEITKAYTSVAAQLGAVQGHALSSTQAMGVMKASMDLAEGSGENLGSATTSLAKAMQAFQTPTKDAGQAADILFTAARDTGAGLGGVTQTLVRLRSTLGVTSPDMGQLSGLMVDLADHGESGRKAMSSMNSAMTTLLKPSTELQQSLAQQQTALKALPPGMAELAAGYESGTLSSQTLSKATSAMTVGQKDQWAAFTAATDAVKKNSTSIHDAGVEVTDAHGKFVGMASIIDQLKPKLDGETQSQQLATLATVFGTSANKTLLTTILAGPDAYDKATAAVQRQGSAHAAAQVQAQTLAHQLDALKVDVEDEATKIGVVLIPIVESMGRAFVDVSKFVLDHKAILIGLAVVIGGVLTAAIAAFTINTMASFVKSIQGAASNIGTLIGKFPGMGSAAQAAAGTVATAEEAAAGSVTTASTTIETELEGVQGAFATTGTDAEAMSAKTVLAGGESEMALGGVATGAGGLVAALGPLAIAVGVGGLAWAAYEQITGKTKTAFDKWLTSVEQMKSSSLPQLNAKIADLSTAEDKLSTATHGTGIVSDIARQSLSNLQQQTQTLQAQQTNYTNNLSLLSSQFGLTQSQTQAFATTVGVNLHQAMTTAQVQAFANEVQTSGVQMDGASGKALNMSANTVAALSKMTSAVGAQVASGNWQALGESISQGVAQGINVSANVAIAAAGAMSAAALATAQRVIRAQSPSQEFAEKVGAPMAQGAAMGIEQNAHLVTGATTSMMEDALSVGRTAATGTGANLGAAGARGVGTTAPGTSGGDVIVNIGPGAVVINAPAGAGPGDYAAMQAAIDQGFTRLATELQSGVAPMRAAR